MKKLIYVIWVFLLLTLVTAPVYGASSMIVGPDTIYKQKDSLVTISDIVSLYSSYGNVITLKEDGYTGNGATLGSYYVVIAANDGLNETGSKEIQVKVVETFGTLKINLITSSRAIYVKKDFQLSYKEIIEALSSIELAFYNPQTSSAYLIKDDYSSNWSNPGYYPFHFRIIDTSGFDQSYQTFIYVIEDNQLPVQIIDMNQGGDILQNAFKFFKDFWLLFVIIGIVYFLWRNKKK